MEPRTVVRLLLTLLSVWRSVAEAATDTSTKARNDTESNAEGYHCNAGQVQTWSHNQAEWCCAKHDIGCPFSCSLIGYPKQQVAWSAEKKAWCCAHHKALCREHEEIERAAARRSDDDQAGSEKPSTTEASTSKSRVTSKAQTSTTMAAKDDKAATTTKAAQDAKAASTSEAPAVSEAPTSTEAAEDDEDTDGVSNATADATTTSKAVSEAPTAEPSTTPKSTKAQTTSKGRAPTTKSVSTSKPLTFESLGIAKAQATKHASQQCRCSQNTDYTGHDLFALPANTPEECCQACAVHPHCTVGILFLGRCWLKNSSAVVPGSPGRIACSAGKAHYLAEATAVRGASCAVYGCGGYNPTQKCQCNKKCKKYGNCCFDHMQECLTPAEASCKDHGCDSVYMADRPCQCNRKCNFYGNCCLDYHARCAKGDSTLVFKKFELPAGPGVLFAQGEQGRLLAAVAYFGQGKLLVLASALLMALLAVALRLRGHGLGPRRRGGALTRHAVARDEAIEGGLGVAEDDHGESLLAWWAE